MPVESFGASGHEHVRAAHASTIEVTTDDWLTPTGDCIVGIEADRAPAAFDPAVRSGVRDRDATITLELAVDGLVERVVGRGDPALTLASDRCCIARTSEYVDDRTLMLEADRAAADLDRELVARLQDGAELAVTVRVDPAP